MRSSSRSQTSSSSPSLSRPFTIYPFIVTLCLPISFPYVSLPLSTVSILPNGTSGHFVSFCVIFLLHFLPTCPLFSATIKPFHALLKFPRPPPRSLPLFPSVYLLLSSSLRLLFPLPPSLSVLLTCST